MRSKHVTFCILGFIGLIIVFSCQGRVAGSIYNVTLNEDVQEQFEVGETPLRTVFQYGQDSDNALDILIPVDPAGDRQIAKSHVYYMSKGSKVKFNVETLVNLETWKFDEDFEEHGELNTPRQWISICKGVNPRNGEPIKDTDGDVAKVAITAESIGETFISYLKQCTSGVTNFRDFSERGPFVSNCRTYEFGSETIFDNQNFETTVLPELCFLGAEFTINENSGFSREISVSSYNDSFIGFETKYFSNPISPHIFAVDDDRITTLSVNMSANPQNDDVVDPLVDAGNFLHYSWTMPTDSDGIWQANFASDISIEYVRFYWSDRGRRRSLPIVQDPRLGSPPHTLQVNRGRVCNNVDSDGYFRSNGCSLLSSNTPAATKLDIATPITWRMSILWDPNNYEMAGLWGQPVIMEFGIKADP